jgi:hypothetical protein
MVYRNALRRTGSVALGLPEDDGGCDALEDDMLAGLRRSVNGDHGSEGCCCAHYNPGKLAHGSGICIGKKLRDVWCTSAHFPGAVHMLDVQPTTPYIITTNM